MNFIPGYAFLLVTAFQIFVPCLLGMFLINEGDKYFKNLCNISWHELSLSDQKSLSIMMSAAIEPLKISTNLTVLDLQSFVDVILNFNLASKFY
jgi:hypothetical protein